MFPGEVYLVELRQISEIGSYCFHDRGIRSATRICVSDHQEADETEYGEENDVNAAIPPKDFWTQKARHSIKWTVPSDIENRRLFIWCVTWITPMLRRQDFCFKVGEISISATNASLMGLKETVILFLFHWKQCHCACFVLLSGVGHLLCVTVGLIGIESWLWPWRHGIWQQLRSVMERNFTGVFTVLWWGGVVSPAHREYLWLDFDVKQAFVCETLLLLLYSCNKSTVLFKGHRAPTVVVFSHREEWTHVKMLVSTKIVVCQPSFLGTMPVFPLSTSCSCSVGTDSVIFELSFIIPNGAQRGFVFLVLLPRTSATSVS